MSFHDLLNAGEIYSLGQRLKGRSGNLIDCQKDEKEAFFSLYTQYQHSNDSEMLVKCLLHLCKLGCLELMDTIIKNEIEGETDQALAFLCIIKIFASPE